MNQTPQFVGLIGQHVIRFRGSDLGVELFEIRRGEGLVVKLLLRQQTQESTGHERGNLMWPIRPFTLVPLMYLFLAERDRATFNAVHEQGNGAVLGRVGSNVL